MKTILSRYADGTIYVESDMRTDPYFPLMVKDELRRLAATFVGRELLVRIGTAKPKVKLEGLYHICIRPLADRSFRPKGMQLDKGRLIDVSWLLDVGDNRRFVPGFAGNSHKSISESHSTDGQGSAANVRFTNSVRQMTARGNRPGLTAPPFVGLAHELIHAWHSLCGTKKSNTIEEEKFTVGLDPYAKESITENALRSEADLPKREHY